MQIGMRIIYCSETGKILNGALDEMSGDLQEGLRPDSIDFLDLPFGYDENNFKKAMEYRVDVTKSNDVPFSERIVIDSYFPEIKTPEQLRIEELENELLLASGVI